MSIIQRRDVLKLASVSAIAAAGGGILLAHQRGNYSFNDAEPAKSCRLLRRTIDETKAEASVVPGTVSNTFILIVKGKKPYLNMKVFLSPLTYVRQPEYWGIEVLGCVPGIMLPAIGVYDEFLPLDGIRGTKGIEVVWADGETERIDVPPTG